MSLTPLTLHSMSDEVSDLHVPADITTEQALFFLAATAKWYQMVGERGYGVAFLME